LDLDKWEKNVMGNKDSEKNMSEWTLENNINSELESKCKSPDIVSVIKVQKL
jgi:hypothetical protein